MLENSWIPFMLAAARIQDGRGTDLLEGGRDINLGSHGRKTGI